MERGAKTGHFTVNGDVSTPRLLPPPALLHSHTIALCSALALCSGVKHCELHNVELLHCLRSQIFYSLTCKFIALSWACLFLHNCIVLSSYHRYCCTPPLLHCNGELVDCQLGPLHSILNLVTRVIVEVSEEGPMGICVQYSTIINATQSWGQVEKQSSD